MAYSGLLIQRWNNLIIYLHIYWVHLIPFGLAF